MAISNIYTIFTKFVEERNLPIKLQELKEGTVWCSPARINITGENLHISFTYGALSQGCGSSTVKSYNCWYSNEASRKLAKEILEKFFHLVGTEDKQGIVVTTDSFGIHSFLDLSGFIPLMTFSNPRHTDRGTCLWIKLTGEEKFSDINIDSIRHIGDKTLLAYLDNSLTEKAKATEPKIPSVPDKKEINRWEVTF